MTATDPVQAVAEAMEAHVTGYSMRDGGYTHSCRCGWSASGRDSSARAREHRITALVAAARPPIAAETLREAAGSLYGDERANGDHWHPLSVASWLRECADRIEREGQDDE